jgi:hypothetical protein
MAISLASARKWVNDSELALIEASFGRNATAFTPAVLRGKIERARKLRDKNRDRVRQLKRANRAGTGAKTGRQITAIAVAEKRAQLFDETLARLVVRLQKLNAVRGIDALKSAVAKAVARKRSEKAAAPTRDAPRSARRAGAGPASAATPRLAATQLQRVNQMARVRARNARNQAKRDGRAR